MINPTKKVTEPKNLKKAKSGYSIILKKGGQKYESYRKNNNKNYKYIKIYVHLLAQKKHWTMNKMYNYLLELGCKTYVNKMEIQYTNIELDDKNNDND